MKTRILMLLAAVLLGSASAMAQSSNSEPLKGDVNGDGIVDVADINAVIKIMKDGGGTSEETKYYFSVGTTEVTSSNYTTANNATTTIPTSIEYTSSQRVRHYFLVPSNKTLSVIDKNLNASVPVTEQTGHGISNHKLYYTNGAIASGATVVITLSPSEYYYAGQNSGDNYITDSNYTSIATQSAFTTKDVSMTTNNYLYVVVPTSKTVEVTDPAGNYVNFKYFNTETGQYGNGTRSVGDYYIMRSTMAAAVNETWTVIVKSPETYYWYVGTTLPTADNIASIATESLTEMPNWSAENPQSIAATNNTGASSYIYYCFPSDWNVTVFDSDKTSEVQLADVSTFTAYGVNYTVKRTGRNIADGSTKDYYATISVTYYYYVGTTKPTSLSQATVVDAYQSEYTYTNNSGAKAHIFVLTNSDQSVEFIEPNFDAPITQVEVDVTTIPGYKIFETAVGTANTSSVKIRISPETAWYYYAGWTLPTAANVDEIINETYPAESGSTTTHTAGKKTSSKSTMDYTSNTLYNANAKATYYVLVPTGHAIYDSLDNNVIASTFTSQGNITVGNQTHTVYSSNTTSRNIGAIIIK